MISPRTRSGQPEPVHSVTTAMAMIARLTTTSLRAERNAARLSEPTRVPQPGEHAQRYVPFTSDRPERAVSTSGTTAGGDGIGEAAERPPRPRANAGTRITSAMALPATARRAQRPPERRGRSAG